MAKEPFEEASWPIHGKKNMNSSLHGVVLVGAHAWARILKTTFILEVARAMLV
jgi:hypothetical protein